MSVVRFVYEKSPLADVAARCYAFVMGPEYHDGITIGTLERYHTPGLAKVIDGHPYVCECGHYLVAPFATDRGLINVIVAGLGPTGGGGAEVFERYRRAIGSIVRRAAELKVDELVLQLPIPDAIGVSQDYLVGQTVIAVDMAYYHCDDFITDASRKQVPELTVKLVDGFGEPHSGQPALTYGSLCARGVRIARHWSDLPADYATPSWLAERAREIAVFHGFKITTFVEHEVRHMGMGGLAGVSRGSERDCHLVVLEYTSKNPNARTIGFVGKGITFDSGGLSIKPSDGMETMKSDMAGAAAVVGAMDALGSLEPDVNIVAIVPLTENLPSGKALKPGDIITLYNGMTAEVLNTDAEGRLILADALAYAVKHYTLDAIVDVATLTGACVVALGPFYSGLLSAHDALVARILEASRVSGDRVWRLPLSEDYKAAIKSEYADIKNTGNRKYMAGTITAACFLQNFVGSVPWAHLDIAGTAFDVPGVSYYRSGATGAGVRLLIELAMNWNKQPHGATPADGAVRTS